jgi:hypothetical protein
MAPPNNRWQRAGKHKVLGCGRPSTVHSSAPRVRLLTRQPAGADAGR